MNLEKAEITWRYLCIPIQIITVKEELLLYREQDHYGDTDSSHLLPRFHESYLKITEGTSFLRFFIYTDPDLLLWIAYATPHREEAQQALNSVAIIAPNHPGLPEARDRHFQREAFLVPQNRPMFHCPYCHTTVLPRIERKVSTAGWVVFTFLLLCTIIFCWIGLFIKEDYRVCSQCGMKLG
jgi:LITAF-like zinc ribbon domain